MPGNDHTKKYSAADIERYIKGQMTAAEMYALEKDMQDDPFLAEAVEGYMTTPVSSIQAPMQDLSARLAQRTDQKTVSIRQNRRWLAVAAAILIILGSGATWFLLNPATEKNIAQHDQEEKAAEAVVPETDTATVGAAAAEEASPPTEKEAAPKITQAEEKKEAAPRKVEKPGAPVAQPATTPQSLPVAEAGRPADNETVEESTRESRAKAYRADQAETFLKTAPARQAPQQHIATYIIGGTVTDSTDKPLPFVNITVANTHINTYTDANGQFRVITGDSAVTAHIKSVGYEEQNVQLHAGAKVNRVQLKTADNNMEEVVVAGYGTKKKQAATRERKNTSDSLADEEDGPWAEPRDGWGNYDIYLLNNVRLKSTLKGSVDISFMISPSGRLYDFQVEHATCSGCDREAIRLIKEGPAWQLHNSTVPYRVSVSIQF